nr:DBH-like monooxygenase protein 2 [Cherax quadricarinatus]
MSEKVILIVEEALGIQVSAEAQVFCSSIEVFRSAVDIDVTLLSSRFTKTERFASKKGYMLNRLSECLQRMMWSCHHWLVDSHYAADFQQSRRLTKEVKILPGDHLTVECDYDSSGQDSGTFTGWKARDEMCQAFIYYYPRVNMSLCRSSPHPGLLQDTFGIGNFSKDLKLDTFEFIP